MTTLTNELKKQPIKNYDHQIIKDEHLQMWFTGQDLAMDVAKIKKYVVEQKIVRGDKVLICLENAAVYTILEQAFWELGVCVHPVAATTPISQLQADFNQHSYAALIAKPQLADQIVNDAVLERTQLNLHTAKELPVFFNTQITKQRTLHSIIEPQADDLALILNTSGTTGQPKRVGLTHEMLVNAAHHNIDSHGLGSQDVTMVVMPMFHINAQVISILSTRLSNGKLVIDQKFSASHFWQQISDNRVTWVSVVPTIIAILLMNEAANEVFATQADKIRLRFLRSASFSLPGSRLVEFQERFAVPIVEGYGMTETASECTLNPIEAPKIGSAGKPLGTTIAILVDGRYETKDTALGEIVVRGDHVISHYLDEATDAFQEGWLLTGDLGYIDEEGYLFIKGRKKEMINRGGEKVAPTEVESVLLQLDFIEDVAVVGLPDELYGEKVVAVVQVSAHSEADEQTYGQQVLHFAKQHLAKYEQPTTVCFVNAFPRNPTGKIMRHRLQEQLTETIVGDQR